MEFITQELFPPTFASAAAIAVVETTDLSPDSNIKSKTVILAVFKGDICSVYEVETATAATTATATPCSSSVGAAGVKDLMFEDWVGCHVTLVASTCDGSLTGVSDDLEIVIFTFDLVRKRILKRFQSLLPNDDSAKVQRRTFTPALVVCHSSGGQSALFHGYENYIHSISVRLILSSHLTTPFEGAITRYQLAKASPYSLAYLANDASQYMTLYSGGIADKPPNANQIGSNGFYSTISKDKVSLITQSPITTDRIGSGRSHRVKGLPFLTCCLTKMNTTVVVTDEVVALMMPGGGFSNPVVQYPHGIHGLLENHVSVIAVFDTTPINAILTVGANAPINSVILALSDGRYFRILLDNSSDDCDSFSKQINPFHSWDNPEIFLEKRCSRPSDASEDDTFTSCQSVTSQTSSNAEATPVMPSHSPALPTAAAAASATSPLVYWNYSSMVRGLVAGISATNGDVFIMKPSIGSVLPSSVATCEKRRMATGHVGPNRLLRGVVTSSLVVNEELITSTSEGYLRRSQVLLDTDVVAEISSESFVSKASNHQIPQKISPPTSEAAEDECPTSVAIVVLSGVSSTKFLIKRDDDLEMFDQKDGFIMGDSTLAFSVLSATEAVQITSSGSFWYSLDVSSGTTVSVKLTSSLRTKILKANVCDRAIVILRETEDKRRELLFFSREDSAQSIVALVGFSEEVSSLAVLPRRSSGDKSVKAVLSFWNNSSKLLVVANDESSLEVAVNLSNVVSQVEGTTLEITAVEPLNLFWVVLQLSDGSLAGQKLSVGDALTFPISTPLLSSSVYMPGTVSVERSLSTILVGGPTSITMLGIRTSGGSPSSTATSTDANVLAEHATGLSVVSERRYGIPLIRPSRFDSATVSYNGLPMTCLAFFGSASELSARPQVVISAGTKTVIADLRTSYSNKILSERRVGVSVLSLVLCEPPMALSHAVNAEKKPSTLNSGEQPIGLLAIVESAPSEDRFPSGYSATLLHLRKQMLAPADQRALPPTFIPSCCVSSNAAPFQMEAPLNIKLPTTSTANDTNSGTTVKRPTGTFAPSETHIVVGGCDISNGTGKLITFSITGATFTTSSQMTTSAPVNDITFTVADHELAVVAATHFELLLFKFGGYGTNNSHLLPLTSLRLVTPVLSLASSLSVIAAVSSGLMTYYEYSVGSLRERTVEILPLSTHTAVAGVDGHFLKCDAARNLFVNSVQEKSRKTAKMDEIEDKYSIPLKACVRLPSWATKISVSEGILRPIIETTRLHMGVNTAFDPLFSICGISKKFLVAGSDGSLTSMVRVPHDLFRFLLRVESCLETFLDYERRDYYLKHWESTRAETDGPMPHKDQSAQLPQALWTIRDAKQCVSECRTIRSSNIINLKTINNAYFSHLSEHDRRVLVKEHLQPESSDLLTPVTVSAILQRCSTLF